MNLLRLDTLSEKGISFMKNRSDKNRPPDFDVLQKSLAAEWLTRLDKETSNDSPQNKDKKSNDSTV